MQGQLAGWTGKSSCREKSTTLDFPTLTTTAAETEMETESTRADSFHINAAAGAKPLQQQTRAVNVACRCTNK
ncbi:unnamed protein product [Ceratitis capitata]|uniref:(Mediterranean fruit fly) hypothetical protein n=1 Tax=Ceratitis capitata TaxID=7213 RepID=A0A811U2C3_CERCA|nr:unnamed protein product [Ceratitis capitata]